MSIFWESCCWGTSRLILGTISCIAGPFGNSWRWCFLDSKRTGSSWEIDPLTAISWPLGQLVINLTISSGLVSCLHASSVLSSRSCQGGEGKSQSDMDKHQYWCCLWFYILVRRAIVIISHVTVQTSILCNLWYQTKIYNWIEWHAQYRSGWQGGVVRVRLGKETWGGCASLSLPRLDSRVLFFFFFYKSVETLTS